MCTVYKQCLGCHLPAGEGYTHGWHAQCFVEWARRQEFTDEEISEMLVEEEQHIIPEEK